MGDHQFGSFTQGIIDLLINTTGEFVTERHGVCSLCLWRHELHGQGVQWTGSDGDPGSDTLYQVLPPVQVVLQGRALLCYG